MKHVFILFTSLLLLIVSGAHAQQWTWLTGGNTPNVLPNYVDDPGGRQKCSMWAGHDGILYLFGGDNFDSNFVFGDLWSFDTLTTEWTWIAGSSSPNSPGIYGVLGESQQGNQPGSRKDAASWVDSQGNLWLFGGVGYGVTSELGRLNDLWKYDPVVGLWTWISGSNQVNIYGNYGETGVPSNTNMPGTRGESAHWISNDELYLFGGNGQGDVSNGYLKDLWKYSISENQWVHLGGGGIADVAPNYGELNTSSSTNHPGTRVGSCNWISSDGTKLYLFGGAGGAWGGVLNDLWQYDLSTNNWTWIGGTSTTGDLGSTGELGVPSINNRPAGRLQAVSFAQNNYLWLFGGYTNYYINDLWRYNITTGEWTWMGGEVNGGDLGAYLEQGPSSLPNYPSNKEGAQGCVSDNGKFWLFGGTGSVGGVMNDLWKLEVAPDAPMMTCNPLPANLQNGLVGYWPFCGNANDESGNGNDGVVNGATLTEDRFGNAGSAYSFDGWSAEVVVGNPSNIPIGNSQYSIQAWFKNEGNPNGHILWYGMPEGFSSNAVRLAQDHCTNGALSNSGICNYWYYSDLCYCEDSALVNSRLQSNEWHQVIYTYDGVERNLYIDGMYIDSLVGSDMNVPAINELVIGRYPYYDYYGFNGDLDDIAIWNRALTAEEITVLFNDYSLLVTYYLDNDGDTFGDPNSSVETNTGMPVGYSANNVDCDDTNALINIPEHPIFNSFGPFCAGSDIPSLPTISANGLEGIWSPAINNLETTTYTFTPNINQCAYAGNYTVEILPIPQVSIINSVSCVEQVATITAIVEPLGNYEYNWLVPAEATNPGNVSTFTTSIDGFYSVVVNAACFDSSQINTQNGDTIIGCDESYFPVCGCDGETYANACYAYTQGIIHYSLGECSGIASFYCPSTEATTEVSIQTSNTPTFGSFGPYCSGSSIPTLPTTSQNGISGSWSPAINNQETTSYTFTPDAGQCASSVTRTITITPTLTPSFGIFGPYCAGSSIPGLPTTSTNGITGNWSPAINNQETTTYTFTPNAGQCASSITRTISIAQTVITCYLDEDNDGWGIEGTFIQTCECPAGYSDILGDCDDTNNQSNPDASEVCLDQIDNNCNIEIDEECVLGCTSFDACNFDWLATIDDGSCAFNGEPCDDGDFMTMDDIIMNCFCGEIPVDIAAPHICGANSVHNPNLPYSIMTDQEGNVYRTIIIGEQEWMAENLKTSTYRNGDTIPLVTDDSEWSTLNTGAYCFYNNDATFNCPFGKLYNWYTVVDSRNVCPVGWHVPTDDELSLLVNYLDPDADGGNNTNASGGKMKSFGLQYWTYPNLSAANGSGFSGLPGGARYPLGPSSSLNYIGYWWSSTEGNSNYAWARVLDSNSGSCHRWGPEFSKRFGFSVRCLRDNNTGLIPGCTDMFACNYNSSATEDDGSCQFSGSPCDDANASTINDIIDASCGCAGTPVEIGVEHTCGAPNVHNPNLNYGSVTDQEGNVYKTIVIGDQEWMAENLNTSIYRNGDAIPTGYDFNTWGGTTSGSWSYYNDNANGECPFGKLYNWYTVADSRQLCPSGWHVPTEEEWNSLIEYLGGYSVAGGKMKSTGNIDLTTGLWYSPNGGATNSSGFSGLPGGDRNGGGAYYDLGLGVWWTSTTLDDINAYSKILNYTDGALQPSLNNYHYGFSVRCMNDEAVGLIPGCTDLLACNYNSSATEDDGSCQFSGSPCDDANASTINDIIDASCGCVGTPIELGVEHTCGASLVHNPNLTYGSMTDQEGNVYKTIVIGDQEWMAENLKTSIYRNGDAIATGLDVPSWSSTTEGAWAFYNNDPSYECPYGKLYNWYSTVDPRELCPAGWHAPSNSEYDALISYLGGGGIAGGKMKSVGVFENTTGYWLSPNTEATNTSGFSALPGGYRYSSGEFVALGGLNILSTTTESEEFYMFLRFLGNDGGYAGGHGSGHKRDGFSVRCLRDANTGLIPGCTDLLACNYNPDATEEDGSCYFPGCIDPLAFNYNPLAGCNDGSCIYTQIPGCTDPIAFNYNPQANQNEGCLYTASVFVYNDLNGNGEHESNEPGLSNWPVVGNDINGLLWTNGNGNAFVAVPQGAYQFTVLNTTDNWVSTTPTSATLDLPAGPATASFGLQVIPGEAIVAAGPFTGFWDILHCTDGYESGVYLENIGSQTVSGFMTLTCDPLFTPNASSYFTTPPAETGPGYALWNIADFLPGEYELLSYFVPGPGVEYLNAVFNFSLELTLLDPQGNIIYDETWDASPIVACAYDPNDLTGYPEGLDSPHDEGYTIEHFMRPDNMVEFRVRFQNTGTLPAEDIDIYIPIDASVWDLSTIEPLARAADMQVLCLHDGGDIDFSLYDSLEHELPEGVSASDLLIFSFEDIFLPDSASDPDGSQGYVFFQMQAKHGLDVNTELNAQAFIYFEQNPPITTNETYHVIFDCESFTPMVGDTEICDGESLIFDATQPYVDAYEWQLNNVVIGSANTLQYPAEVGTYTLELNTKNVLCPQGENHDVTVIVHEIPELNLPLDATVCEGEELNYEAESNGSVTWSSGANTGDTFTADQSFTVTATAIGEGNCSTSEDWMVTVNPLPTAAVDSANFVLTAIDGVAWQWSVNGAVDATTQSVTASVSGNYQVEITNEFGCIAISDVIEVELPIPDNVFVHSWSTLHLYPNPMTTGARLELPQGTFDVALYDITGACIRTLSKQQGTVVIERESLASGVYQLQVSQGEVMKSVRLVVE